MRSLKRVTKYRLRSGTLERDSFKKIPKVRSKILSKLFIPLFFNGFKKKNIFLRKCGKY